MLGWQIHFFGQLKHTHIGHRILDFLGFQEGFSSVVSDGSAVYADVSGSLSDSVGSVTVAAVSVSSIAGSADTASVSTSSPGESSDLVAATSSFLRAAASAAGVPAACKPLVMPV